MSKPNARKVPGGLIGTGINIEGEDDLEFCLRKAESREDAVKGRQASCSQTLQVTRERRRDDDEVREAVADQSIGVVISRLSSSSASHDL